MDASEPTFVGAHRQAVVTGLVAAFDDVRASGTPLWIALEAPSGWGKTRIAREFYARLARERQTAPAYWPPDMLASRSAETEAVNVRRKVVFPAVTHVPGSLPDFAWWGVACSTRGGVESVALAHDMGQFEAHAPFLEDAWRTRVSRMKQWGSGLRAFGGAAADEAAMEIAGSVVEAVAGAAVPGLGLVRWLGERAADQVRTTTQRRERLRGDDALVAHADLVDETTGMITRLALPSLPVVVFVEDLHLADASLAELLGTLASRDECAVLIVTTSLPGTATRSPHVASAMQAAGERLRDLTHETRVPPQPFPAAASLAPLDDEALGAILDHSYPRSDPDTRAAIVARYRSPLTLELFCRLPRVQRRASTGVLTMSPESIADAPTEIRALYRELWDALPDRVREALSLAVLGAPQPEAGGPWNTPLLLEALATLDWPSLDEIGEALEADADAYSWVRRVSDLLQAFHEPDQAHIAAADDAFLDRADRAEVRAALAAAVHRLAADTEREVDVDEALHLADVALVLHAEGFLTDADAVGSAVLGAMNRLVPLPRETHRRIALADAALATLPDGPLMLQIRWGRADALVALGHAERAAADLVVVVQGLTSTEYAADTLLRAVDDLGYALLAAGRTQEAYEVFVSNTASAVHAFGDTHPETLMRQSGVARALSDLGRWHEAAELNRAIHAERARQLGTDHPDTLTTLNNLAVDIELAGRPEDAMPLHEALVASRTRALGADHALTLASRSNLASSLIDVGDTERAIVELTQLTVDSERVLGPDHPDRLYASGQLARALATQGRHDEALALNEFVLDARMRALGSDHPETLTSANNIAETLAALGRDDEAIARHERVLATRERVLGPDHPHTLVSQGNLAGALTRAGRDAEAIGVHDDIVLRMSELFGATHRKALVARHNRALALSRVGEIDAAIAAQRSVLDDADIDLVTHRELIVEGSVNLAISLRTADRPRDAATTIIDLLATIDARAWADHVDVLLVHRHLVDALNEADDASAAIEAATASLVAHERALGAGHPDTVVAADQLAYARLRAASADDPVGEAG